MALSRLIGSRAERVVALYRQGNTLKEIAAEVGENYEMVRRAVGEAGAMRPMGREPLPRETVATVLRLYADPTIPPKDVAVLAGIARSTLYLILEREGVPRRTAVPAQPAHRRRRAQ